MDWTLIGALLGLAALSLLAGAALGYWTAAKDTREAEAKARARGFQEGIETAWLEIGPSARRMAAVNLRTNPPTERN